MRKYNLAGRPLSQADFGSVSANDASPEKARVRREDGKTIGSVFSAH
ncbi:hypothetical protein ACC808_19020 [Rhizobium ruizarguesonis]